MSEQSVTYADLKFQTPSKQQKKKTPKNTRDKEGNEEGLTYTGLKYYNASQQERRGRTRNSQSKDSPAPAPACGLTAGILGIFCLALLIAVGILTAKVFQISQIPCKEQENLNQFQEIIPGRKFALCAANWFLHGEKCYHFSTEYKPWLESQQACSSHGSRLLQIEGKQELYFINPLSNSHWVGLLRDKTGRAWMWANGTAFSTHQFAVEKGYVDGDCAVVKGGELFSDDCQDTKRYICELPVLVPESDVSGQDRSQKS